MYNIRVHMHTLLNHYFSKCLLKRAAVFQQESPNVCSLFIMLHTGYRMHALET